MPVTPDLSENAPSIGKGRYVLVSRIGEGGMAGVYRAWDKKLRVWRAVKVLLPEFAKRRKVRARFESEAHTMARLEHDNLVRIYDVGDAGELPFLVMELVSGGTLQGWTRRHGPMPARLAVEVMLQVTSGVLVAHAAGIVHRDIKPQNILIAPSGTCKLTDFGIAHVDDEAMTRTGSVLGTLGYMAPEQRNDAKSVDVRADVYSLGATLWHLLTGEVAQDLFLATDNARMLEAVDEPLRPLLCRCVAYDRGDRFADVHALVAALQEVHGRLPEVSFETPDLVLDTTEEEVAVEDTDFGEIHDLLDAAGLAARAAETSTPGEAPRLGASSKGPLPYFMPPADRSRKRTPAGVDRTDSDALPDWIDQGSLSRSKPIGEDAVIGAGVPVSSTPYLSPDRATPHLADHARLVTDEKTQPPRDPSPSRSPDTARPQRGSDSGNPPRPVVPTPTPAPPSLPPVEDEPSIVQRLIGLAIIPLGLLVAAATVLVIVLAIGFSFAARDLQDAERSAVDSRARLYAVLQDDRMVVDQLAVLGADRAVLEDRWLAFTETKGEPARTRAALTFLEEMDREATRSRVDEGVSLAEVEANHTLRRMRSARQAYETSLATWEEVASAPQGRVVILLGAAKAPEN